MSETLKFGNGQWATKEGSTLAYNDENGNFKPLPFNFTRATSATRVNKDGLIEVVTNNKPRIDYKDDASGALLLEPQRTNLITYSEDFTGWTLTNVVETPNALISPDGDLNANFAIPTTNGIHQLRLTLSSVTGLYTQSIYAKQGGYKNLLVWDDNTSGGVGVNLDDLSIFRNQNNSGYDVQNVGNGWVRISVTHNYSAQAMLPSLYIYDNSATPSISYTGDGTSGIYIYGAQLEQGSYATSYIPTTSGSAVTRATDSCSQTVPDGVIGQTEGTMYAEIDFKSKPEAGSPIVGIMALNNNVTNLQNCIILGIERKSGGVNRFYPFVQVGNSTTASIIGSTLTDGNYKVAFAYKQNDFILYVNGVQIGTDTNGAVPTTSQVLVGERYNGDTFKIADGIKETKLYNTRLSNAELAALTT